MSKDTIYRQDTIDAMCKLMNSWFGSDSSKDEREEITWIINHLPSAQPEIIHCRDCKHWERNYYQDVETCFEHRNVDGTEQATPPEYYCGSAERREK